MEQTDNKTINLLFDRPEKQKTTQENEATTLSTVVSRFFSDSLSESHVNSIIEEEKPELITLLGLDGVGKTTFIGTLFHLLRVEGKLDDYEFVDSDTLAGFERKIFLRKVNRESFSITQRTTVKENPFLTLKFVNKTNGEERAIVFSDKPGETYRDYIKHIETVKSEKTLQLSDRILLFVDSEQLTNKNYLSMKDDLQSFFRRLNDNSLISAKSKLYVVFNKYDKVEGFEENDTFKKRKAELEGMIKETFNITDELNGFNVNSKKHNFEATSRLFKELIYPIEKSVSDLDIDWVKNSIENL